MTSRLLTLTAALAFAACLTLTACGGQGADNTPGESSRSLDSTPFLGTWKRNDATAAGDLANCFNFNTYGGTFGGLNRPSVVTNTTLTSTVEVYSDNTCATYLGYLVTNYSVVFSAGSIPGKTDVINALITSTGYSIDPDGTAGFTLSSLPANGVVSKQVFDVERTLMYVGNTSGQLDASGYPTTLQATALYTR